MDAKTAANYLTEILRNHTDLRLLEIDGSITLWLPRPGDVPVRTFEILVPEDLVEIYENLQKQKNTPLTEEELAECRRGRYVSVIKMVRERTGMNLKDAKAWVDKHRPPKDECGPPPTFPACSMK